MQANKFLFKRGLSYRHETEAGPFSPVVFLQIM
jgi:hypothetical protein